MIEVEALRADIQESVRQMRLCQGELITHIDALGAREAEYRECIDATERALRLLAEDWRKQRAVNAELLDFLWRTETPEHFSKLGVALCESLK